MGIFCGILSLPHNNVMYQNNVMIFIRGAFSYLTS